MAYLEMRGITKVFPGGVVANEDVSLSIEKGEIHALLGENGAGKSTLMNILYGLYQQSAGTIRLRGEEVRISDPKHAIDLGIGMVHQHFMLIPALTVIENVVLGLRENKFKLDLAAAAKEFEELARRYNMYVDPWAEVWQLSVGQQQRLEILKALYRGADLLILDEPTAVLTPQEVDEMFSMIHRFVEEDHTVIFISHKLAEVMRMCTRCTVLRRGRLEATVDVCNIADQQELAQLMVGKNVELTTEKQPARPGEEALKVSGLCAKNNKGLEALHGLDFTIRSGEILGVCGVDGNGQSELVECIAGLRPVTSGAVEIAGKNLTNRPVREINRQKVSHIPEDRHRMGMIADMSVEENIMLMCYRDPPYAKNGFVNWREVDALSEKICGEYEVKTPSIHERAGKLSGGNQQKFVVGREMVREPDLLLAVHPDRGLDIGATKYIQSRIVAERDRGAAVLLVSGELDEILELSDRIIVLYEGKIMDTLDAADATREKLGLLMAGVRDR